MSDLHSAILFCWKITVLNSYVVVVVEHLHEARAQTCSHSADSEHRKPRQSLLHQSSEELGRYQMKQLAVLIKARYSFIVVLCIIASFESSAINSVFPSRNLLSTDPLLSNEDTRITMDKNLRECCICLASFPFRTMNESDLEVYLVFIASTRQSIFVMHVGWRFCFKVQNDGDVQYAEKYQSIITLFHLG